MRWGLLLAGLLGTGCLRAAPRPDLVPRYGGQDRSVGTPLREDRAMVGIAELRYGSRQVAGQAFLQQASVLMDAEDWEMGMRRLNAAWVLWPDAPGLDAAFARALAQ